MALAGSRTWCHRHSAVDGGTMAGDGPTSPESCRYNVLGSHWPRGVHRVGEWSTTNSSRGSKRATWVRGRRYAQFGSLSSPAGGSGVSVREKGESTCASGLRPWRGAWGQWAASPSGKGKHGPRGRGGRERKAGPSSQKQRGSFFLFYFKAFSKLIFKSNSNHFKF